MPLPWASSLAAGQDSASQLLRRRPSAARGHGRRPALSIDAALVTRSSNEHDVDRRPPLTASQSVSAHTEPVQRPAAWPSAQSQQVLSSVVAIRSRASAFIRTLASRIGQLPQAQALSALFPLSPQPGAAAAAPRHAVTPPDMRPASHSVYPHPITKVDPVQGQPLLGRFLERADRLEVLYASLLSDLSNMAYEADRVNDAMLQRHQLVLVSSSGKPLFGPITREAFQQQLDQAQAARSASQQPAQHPQQQHLKLQLQQHQLDVGHAGGGMGPVAPAHPDVQSPSTLLHLASSSMDVMDMADAMGPADHCSGYQGCPDVEYSMLITSSMESLLDSIDEASSLLPFDYKLDSMASADDFSPGASLEQVPGQPQLPRKLTAFRPRSAPSAAHAVGGSPASAVSAALGASVGHPAPAGLHGMQHGAQHGAGAHELRQQRHQLKQAQHKRQQQAAATQQQQVQQQLKQQQQQQQQRYHPDGIRRDTDSPDSPQAANLIEQPAPPAAWFCVDDPVTKVRYFIIQGSTNFDHWAINFNFEPVLFEDPSLGARIHRGVYEAALRLYDDLLPLVRQHLATSPSATVCFAGHSLGGSLSTALLLLLVHRKVLRPSALSPSFTFGAPAVFCAGSGGIGTHSAEPQSTPTSPASPPASTAHLGHTAPSSLPFVAQAMGASAALDAHHLEGPESIAPPACPVVAGIPACSTLYPHPATHVAAATPAPALPAHAHAPHRCDSCQLHCDAHLSSAADRAQRDAMELRTCGRRKPLLEQLGIAEDLVVNVMMHKDIVPRAFVCDYTVVADLLKQWMPSFKDHSTLSSNQQHKSLYSFLGRVAVLRPGDDAPFVSGDAAHPMLPNTPGLYRLRDPRHVMHLSGSYDSLASSGADAAPPCALDSARHLRRQYTHAAPPSASSSASSSSSSSLAVTDGAPYTDADASDVAGSFAGAGYASLVSSASAPSPSAKGRSASSSSSSSNSPGRRTPPAPAATQPVTLRSAFLQFMNYPHPLQSLSLYESYGPQGSISRYHNPDNYTKGLTGLIEGRPAPHSGSVLAAALVAAESEDAPHSGGSGGGTGTTGVRARLPLVSTRAGAAAMAAPLIATMGLLAVIGV